MPNQSAEPSKNAVDLLQLVRQGKVAPPTVRTFDAAIWRAALEAATSPAEADFIATGLWFAAEFQDRWRRIADLGLAKTSVGVVSRHLAGMANKAHLRVEALMLQARMAAAHTDLTIGSMAHVKLGADDKKAATADMTRTSTVDILNKFAAYIRTVIADSQGGAGLHVAGVEEAYRLCQDIYLLDYLWGHILWRDWRMTQEGQHLRVSPPTPDPWGASTVVAQYRRDQLISEFQGTFTLEWMRSGSVLSPVWRVAISRKDDRFKFNATPLKPGEGPLPAGYILRQILESTEMEPYLHDPLPNLAEPGITLHDLVEAWQLLALAAEGLCRHLFKTRPTQTLAFAPVLRRSDLEDLLSVLRLNPAQRKTVIDFLIYERSAVDGLWSRPFLPVAHGRVTPVLTPLICPNLLRTVELWLSEAAGEAFFQKRGREAEKRMQDNVASSLAKRPWAPAAKVVQGAWEPKINGVRRDIDLVIRIGRTVFVGELKLKKYPVSAAEIGRHVQEFEHAAEQLDIRLAWLEQNKPLLAEKTGFVGDAQDLVLRGLIVSGTPFGSGVKAGGHPVIDLDELLFFFDYDAFLVAADVSARMGYVGVPLRPNLRLDLIEHDPAAAFLAFLEGPVHVRHAELALTADVRLNKLHVSGQTLEWPEPYVDGARLDRDLDQVAETMRTDWRLRVAEAGRRLGGLS